MHTLSTKTDVLMTLDNEDIPKGEYGRFRYFLSNNDIICLWFLTVEEVADTYPAKEKVQTSPPEAPMAPCKAKPFHRLWKAIRQPKSEEHKTSEVGTSETLGSKAVETSALTAGLNDESARIKEPLIKLEESRDQESDAKAEESQSPSLYSETMSDKPEEVDNESRGRSPAGVHHFTMAKNANTPAVRVAATASPKSSPTEDQDPTMSETAAASDHGGNDETYVGDVELEPSLPGESPEKNDSGFESQ
ncbi:MAG: hypothetical protein Q9168_002923 [Polycauliona sp. 1 TL-2023]